MFFSVHDNWSDLLVHEKKDCQQQSRDTGQEVNIPRRIVIKKRNPPTTQIRTGWLNRKQALYVDAKNLIDFFYVNMYKGLIISNYTLNTVGTISLGVESP